MRCPIAAKKRAGTIKTASKIFAQKTADASGDLIDNKIANKIRNIAGKSIKMSTFLKNKNDLMKDTKHRKSVKKLLMNFG